MGPCAFCGFWSTRPLHYFPLSSVRHGRDISTFLDNLMILIWHKIKTGRPRSMFLRQRKDADRRFLPQKCQSPSEEQNINSSNSAHPSPWGDSRAGCQPPPSSQLRGPPIQVLCTAGCTWRGIQVHIIWSKNVVITNLIKLNLLLLKHRVLGHPRVFGKICCELKLPPCHVAAPHISHLICETICNC